MLVRSSSKQTENLKTTEMQLIAARTVYEVV